MQSLNKSSCRISHPADSKACTIPMETKESKKASQKQTSRSAPGRERKTTKAENRKGKMVTNSRPTIDTEPYTVLRIQEIRESPADRQTQMPQTKPKIQKNARIHEDRLRLPGGRSEESNRVKKHTPQSDEDESQPAYEKAEGVHGEGIEIPLIEYTHTILQFLQKFKLF